MSEHIHRRQRAAGLWDEVPVLAYKQDGAAPFRDVTRPWAVSYGISKSRPAATARWSDTSTCTP